MIVKTVDVVGGTEMARLDIELLGDAVFEGYPAVKDVTELLDIAKSPELSGEIVAILTTGLCVWLDNIEVVLKN